MQKAKNIGLSKKPKSGFIYSIPKARAAITAAASAAMLFTQYGQTAKGNETWNVFTGGGSWDTAGNWSGNAVPTSGDLVTFASGYAGTITLGASDVANSLTFQDTGYVLTGGQLTFPTTGGTIAVGSGFTATINSNLAGSITSSNSLNVNGLGTLNLGGSNSYSGQTIISNGTLNITSVNALGATSGTTNGTSVNSGATLELSSGATGAAEKLTLSGIGFGGTAGALLVNSNTTWNGAITLGANATINVNSGYTFAEGSVNIGLGIYTLTIGGAGNVTINGGGITGTGGITQAGSGILTFSGTPTEDANTGPTTINSGTVTLTGTGLTSPVVFGAGATGTLNISKGTGVNIGSLSTVDAIDNNAIIINTSTHYILIINQTTDTSFGGIIEDTGTGGNALSIVKSGSSSLTLTNTNTYHGSTSINAGTLVVNGKLSGVSTSTPASLVTVATGAGAALAGTGTINSPVTLTGSAAGSPGAANTGAIISAGDGATTTGKLTLTSTTAGSVNLASGGSTTYDWKINNATGTAGDASGWDELALTATGLTVGAGNFIDVVPINLSATNFTAGANYKWIIATGVGSTSAPSVASQFQLDTTALGTFASSLGGGVSSSNFTLGEDTGDIYIQYSGAPEPTSMMLLGLGVGGVALRRRRLRLRRRASRW